MWIIVIRFPAVANHDWSLVYDLVLGSDHHWNLLNPERHFFIVVFFSKLSLFCHFIPCCCRCCKNLPALPTRCTHFPFHVLLNMLVSQWAICQGPCLWYAQERAEHLPCLKMRGAEMAPVEPLIHWVTSWKLMSMKMWRYISAWNGSLWGFLLYLCCLWIRCVV